MVEPVKDRKKSVEAAQDPSGANAGPGSAAAANQKGGGEGRKPFSMVVSLFTALVYLLVFIGALGYAALIFRDKDDRVKVAADFVEDKLGKAQQLMDTAPKRFSLLLGGKTVANAEDNPASEQSASPVAEAPQTSAPSPEAPTIVKQEAEPVAANENSAAPPPQSPTQTPSPGPAAETAKPIDLPRPIENAPAISVTDVKASPPENDDLTLKDLVNALDGRVEALSEEVKNLRDKLEQSRKETPVASGSSGEAATVVIAFALQKELDAGRPYTDEIAALTRTGADSALLGVLTTMAESGAPTGEQLREIFKPLAKKIRAEEPTKEEDLATHIIHGASKLVRVRPTGTDQPETLDGNLAKIDAALTHNDYAAAAAAFAALPEWARSQAGAFAQTLDKRLALAKASENLLHGAIAALGGVKK